MNYVTGFYTNGIACCVTHLNVQNFAELLKKVTGVQGCDARKMLYGWMLGSNNFWKHVQKNKAKIYIRDGQEKIAPM